MRKLTALFLLLVSGSVLGQGLPAGITPQMLQQLQSLPPAQQQALAKQYGITLPDQSGGGAVEQLAMPGDALQPPVMEFKEPSEQATREPEESSARERFGRRLFDREVSTFAPTDDAPVPESYRLGVGDQLIVQLFGKENDQLTLQVGRNGNINVPKLGSISLSGLTFEDARELIRTRFQQQLIGVEATVTMGRLRAINVFMAGEVEVPGAYSVSAMTTVTQALFQAGGVSEIGSLRNIQVRRGSDIVATFDTYDLLMQGDATGDVRLQSGDVVFVPPYRGLAAVSGEVKRPKLYELAGGETLKDLVTMAGGYTQDAFPLLAVLDRRPSDSGLMAATSLNLLDSATLALPIQDGDRLRVPKAGDSLTNIVRVSGAVHRPGVYGWFEGMRVSDLLGDARRDLLLEADRNYALIVRYKNALMDIEVEQFSLNDAIDESGGAGDPELKEFDEVLVFSLPVVAGLGKSVLNEEQRTASRYEDDPRLNRSVASTQNEDLEERIRANSREVLLEPVIEKLRSQARQKEPVQVVTISGAVRAPGSYPLFAKTTVADLVKAAGGLTDSAFLPQAELRKMTQGNNGETLARYVDIDLNQALDPLISPILASRDHVTVREIPDWSPQDEITVAGAVAFPGTYLIQRGETIADIVQRAGGLTSEAFPEGAILTRETIAEREAERAQAFATTIRQTFASRLLTEETTTQSLAEIVEIADMLESFEGKGRLLIDLPAAIARDQLANLEVSAGDSLTIPKRTNTLTIVGEVLQQGTHGFDDKLSVEDYISLSAGLSARADDSGIYVVRADGSVTLLDNGWWRFSGAREQLGPGDTIVVPVDARYKEQLASWREITQIVYQAIVSVAAVARL